MDEGQTPFVIVHAKEFVPLLKPVTCDDGLLTLVTLPVPVITVHAPLPDVGLFAASVAVDAQTVCEVPAFDTEGGCCAVIVIVLLFKTAVQ